MKPDRICSTCKAFTGPKFGDGDCRKNSPVPKEGDDGLNWGLWPRVRHNNWCISGWEKRIESSTEEE